MINHGAFPSIVNDKRGISLLETMISILIFMVISSLFPAMFSYLLQSKPVMNDFSYEENVLFIAQLQKEFRRSENYWTNEEQTQLYFDRPEDDNIIHFEKYQDKVRRQVRGLGHEIFLQKISSFHVYERDYGVEIVVTSEGKSYRRGIVHPITLTEMVNVSEVEK